MYSEAAGFAGAVHSGYCLAVGDSCYRFLAHVATLKDPTSQSKSVTQPSPTRPNSLVVLLADGCQLLQLPLHLCQPLLVYCQALLSLQQLMQLQQQAAP